MGSLEDLIAQHGATLLSKDSGFSFASGEGGHVPVRTGDGICLHVSENMCNACFMYMCIHDMCRYV